MALEPDTMEFDAFGKPYTTDFDYDVIYFWTSQYVHATIVAVDSHACERGAVFRLGARRWIEQELGAEALFNVLMFLSKIFINGCRIMHEEQPERILADIHEMGTRFAGTRKKKKTVP